MKQTILLMLCAICCCAELTFDFRNGEQHQWEARKGIELTPGPNGLAIKILQPINELHRGNLNLPAAETDAIQFTYIARFPNPVKTKGYIFFAPKGKGFAEERKFYLPPLISDGKAHSIVVGFRQLRGGKQAWLDCETIDKVRLDLTGDAPGNVELLSFRFTTMEQIALDGKDTSIRWVFPADSAKWERQRHLERNDTEEGLKLTITGYDSNIEHINTNFKAADFPRIKIEYKASKFTKRTSGEIFYATDSMPNYNGDVYFRIPSLATDGKWHTLILQASKNIPAGEKYWTGTVRKIRLDLVNESPGEIILKSIEFLPSALQVPEETTEIKTTRPGWLYPKEAFLNGRLQVTLPPAEYAIYAYGGRPAHFTTTPALTPGNASNQIGSVKTPDGKINFQVKGLPEDFALFITSDKGTPIITGHPFPASVTPNLGKAEGPSIPKQIVFDPNMPYWKGKVIYPKGSFYQSCDCAARHAFSLPDTKISKAILQISADDVIQRVVLNGKDLKGRLSANWKEPSVFDVTDALKAGRNLLAVKWRNNGNVGGLLYELDILDANGKMTRFFSGKDTLAGMGEDLPANWASPDFNGSGFTRADSANAAPFSPWNYVLPYVDLSPAVGETTVALQGPQAIDDVKDAVVTVSFKGTPALDENEIGWLRMEMPDGTPIQAFSGTLKKLFRKNADGTYSARFKDFNLPKVGGELTVMLRAGVYGRTSQGTHSKELHLNARRLPGTARPLESWLEHRPGGSPRFMVNGKPFFPVILSTFYDHKPTGFENKRMGVNVRSLVCGGVTNTWWTGPDTYNFSQVDARVNQYLRETPDAYISAYIWCMPPTWYERKYPDRISRNSDGTQFNYYTATVTFSDPDFRADAKRALEAIVSHLEEEFGSRILIYNLVGGVSFEWQGWGAHSMAQFKRLADYGPAAQRDFREYAKQQGVKADAIPTYEERMRSINGLFRNPVRDAMSMLYDEYYSHSIASCITELAHTVKKTVGRRKVVGCYYGYIFEYANMEYCIGSARHNALQEILDSPDVDYAMSPQSYGHRAIGYPMDDMKPFASLWKHGKMSLMEDDMRTHKTRPNDFYQTINFEQTRAVFQRDWSLMLSRRTPVYVFPIVDGNECDDPVLRQDLENARRAGQYIFEKDFTRKAEIAVVVDEKSCRLLAPHAGRTENPTQRLSWYGHNGVRRDTNRSTQLLTGDLVYAQRERLGQCGAPYDSILLTDVSEHAGEYKLWIFIYDFENSAELQRAVNAIRNAGGTILITYGAGFIDKDGISAKAMSSLFGINLKQIKPGPLQVVWTTPATGGSARSLFGPVETVPTRFACVDPEAAVYGRFSDCEEAAIARKGKTVFFGGNQLKPELIAQVAQEAGVHIWCKPGDALSAGAGIVSLHAASSGRKHIELPEAADVVDLFEKKVVARNATSIDFDMKVLTTRTFMTGNAQEILDALNKGW